jgi:hypothetical protein
MKGHAGGQVLVQPLKLLTDKKGTSYIVLLRNEGDERGGCMF